MTRPARPAEAPQESFFDVLKARMDAAVKAAVTAATAETYEQRISEAAAYAAIRAMLASQNAGDK